MKSIVNGFIFLSSFLLVEVIIGYSQNCIKKNCFCYRDLWFQVENIKKKKNVYKISILDKRIIGGTEAFQGQFDYFAAITVQTSDSSFFCGGALIDHAWILTSGHCVNK